MSADADDLLRRTVLDLSARKDCAWAGIYFVEDDSLVLGPEAGRPDPERRTTVSVLWRDTRIAEIAVDGNIEPAELEAVAERIADLCLVGWDTGGELWQS
jgi:hypothetical protein